MKNKKYHIVGTIPKSNRIITETGNIDTPNIHIYITLVLWSQKSFLVNDEVIQVFSTSE
jgi:hypothetical protein